jgi:hypothetical protein
MKTKTGGRVNKTLSLSMTPEQLDQLNTRMKQLSPMVAGPSHYFRLLMQLDEKKEIVKSAFGLKGEANPFSEGFAC